MFPFALILDMNSSAPRDSTLNRWDAPEPIRRAAFPRLQRIKAASVAPSQGQPLASFTTQENPMEDSARLADQQQGWLTLHCQELIDRLQTWSDHLDTRESSLNAREAELDHRWRQFRTQQRESEKMLQEQEQRLAKIRQQIEVHARRLAFDLPSTKEWG